VKATSKKNQIVTLSYTRRRFIWIWDFEVELYL